MAPLVLITGATGFIGAESLAQALDKGYRTRVVVRKAENIEAVKARYPESVAQLDFVVVPDLNNVDALAGALAGVDYVLHLASPMPGHGGDLQTAYIDPAVKATTAVLDAATRQSLVKRIVITASLASLAPLDILQRPGTEVVMGGNKDVHVDLDTLALSGNPAADGFVKYVVSKVLSHRATIEWAAAHPERAFDIVTVHPSFVVGHDRIQGASKTPRGVNGMLLRTLTQAPAAQFPSALVDVRDVGAAMVAPLAADASVLTPRDRGDGITELLVQAPHITWPEVLEHVKARFPALPVVTTSAGAFTEPLVMKTERAERDFGLTFRPALEAVDQAIEQSTA